MLSSPCFAMINSMMTHFLHDFQNLTFQEVKSSASQKCISHSTFSNTKLPRCVQRTDILSWQTPPLTHICITKAPSDILHSPLLILTQVSRLLHCPFLLTQMFSIIFLTCFEDSHKDEYLTHIQYYSSVLFSHTSRSWW